MSAAAAGSAATSAAGPDAGEGPVLDVGALPGGLRAALEAVLVAADAPVAEDEVAAALGLPPAAVAAALAELAASYAAERRGFVLRRAAGGWRLWSRPDAAALVVAATGRGAARLSRAALETLAVIAYRQPVSRARVAAVRGVDVDGVVRTLTTRGLVTEAGRGPTGAVLYATTPAFLETIGLDTLDDLPPLAPHLPADGELDDLHDGMRDGLRDGLRDRLRDRPHDASRPVAGRSAR